MQTEHIVQLLIAERDRLNVAIQALQGETKRRGRPPKNELANAPEWVQPKKKSRRKFTAAQRKQQRVRMKKYWAARRKEEKSTGRYTIGGKTARKKQATQAAV